MLAKLSKKLTIVNRHKLRMHIQRVRYGIFWHMLKSDLRSFCRDKLSTKTSRVLPNSLCLLLLCLTISSFVCFVFTIFCWVKVSLTFWLLKKYLRLKSHLLTFESWYIAPISQILLLTDYTRSLVIEIHHWHSFISDQDRVREWLESNYNRIWG